MYVLNMYINITTSTMITHDYLYSVNLMQSDLKCFGEYIVFERILHTKLL